jgi:ankyrin repeat protein
MKTSGISLARCFKPAHIGLILFQVTFAGLAQSNFTREETLNFFGTIQSGSENDALAMLESNTNLVKSVVNPLLEAASAGKAKLVQRMLELGIDANIQDSMGGQNTALHCAIQRNHWEVCRVLLEAGADPNRMAFGFQTPLHMAFNENHEDIAGLLLDYGAEPFQGKLFSNDETTPFELAITKSDGRLVPRMLGQDSRHPLGTKSLQKPRHSKQPRRGMKTSAEILTQRGVGLVTVAAQRGEWEALTALFRAGVNIKDAGTNCPTLLQAYSLAANDNAKNLPGVAGQWHRVQDQLKADYMARADANFVASLRSQESSLSNRVVMMSPDRWHKILDVLIDHGADYDAFAATALGDAAQANKLIAQNKNVVQTRDCQGETPLHWAIHTEQPAMAALWISAGVPLNVTNDAGQTALHLAASAGNADDVKNLLAARASTGIRDTNGWTALDAAIQNQQSDCIHLLLPENPAATHPERGLSMSLHEAAAAGNIAALAALVETETHLEARNELGLTPLQVAVTKGHLAAAALLVDKGADVNVRDPAGNSLLHQILLQERLTIYDRPPTHWLERVGQDPGKKLYVQYLTVGQYEQGPNPLLQAASFLLACGADATAKNKAGDTPMQLIADQKTGRGVFFFDNDREKLLQLLSVHGGNVDARDADGNTALHRLCTGYYDVNKVESMASLIAAGANVNATNNLGQTPLHVAAQNIGGWDNNDPPVNEPFQLLIYKKADVNARDNQGRTPLDVLAAADTSFKEEAVALLIKAGAKANQTNPGGATALYQVIAAHQPFSQGTVKSLLDSGASPNARDEQGRTPVHMALTGEWPWNSAGESLQLLAKTGADFSARDNDGKTPLHYLAALGGQMPMIFIHGVDQIFVDAKVDFQARDNEGNTPAIIAAKTGTKDVFDWLVKQGADLDLTNNQGETARLLLAHQKDSFPRSGPGNAETDIFQAAREGNIDAATRLLKADPTLVNQTNQYQQTPLRLAVTLHQTNLAGFLESRGAIWDAGSAVLAGRTNELEKILKHDPPAAGMKIFGKGLLHIAAANNDLTTAQLLVAAKAEVNAMDNWGVSPLGYARIKHHQEVEEFLRQHGAKENLFDAVYADDLNTVTTLLEPDQSLANASTNERISAVSVAVAAGRTNILRLLLKHGASVAEDHAGLAAYYNQPGCLALLIRAGAKLDQTDRNGFTPLHWAAIRGSTGVAELLLKHKVDINRAVVEMDPHQSHMMSPDRGTISGDAPLHLAALCGETNMIALLLKAGADVNAANTAQMTPLDLANNRRPPSFSLENIQRNMAGLLTPLDDPQNLVAKMQTTMSGRKAAVDMIKASGGKQSSNYAPFGRTF